MKSSCLKVLYYYKTEEGKKRRGGKQNTTETRQNTSLGSSKTEASKLA